MNQNKSSHEKGQSLVELAISFTFLLILLGGIVDLGMMFYTYLSLRDTAQEGAIYGSYDPTNITEITNRIQASSSWPIDSSRITDIMVYCNGIGNSCQVSNINSCPGKAITVRVIYSYQPLLPMLSTVTGGGPISLNATVTDTILNSDATIADLKTQNITCPSP